jgi:hypothetical protein
MRKALTLMFVGAVLVVASATFQHGKVRAATPSKNSPAHPAPPQSFPTTDPLSITMVCHESTTNGINTDYLNAIDVYPNSAVAPNPTQGGAAYGVTLGKVYLEVNFETDTIGTPTSCAALSDSLTHIYSMSLTHAFSHNPGYYIEIWSK